MKVSVANLENMEAYQYFTGLDEQGAPIWKKGSAAIGEATPILEGPIGEISVIYNQYLGNFIITYLAEDSGSIVMRR